MPNFILLLYDDPSGWQKLSPDDMQKAIEKYMAWGRKPFVVGTGRLAEDAGRVPERPQFFNCGKPRGRTRS